MVATPLVWLSNFEQDYMQGLWSRNLSRVVRLVQAHCVNWWMVKEQVTSVRASGSTAAFRAAISFAWRTVCAYLLEQVFHEPRISALQYFWSFPLAAKLALSNSTRSRSPFWIFCPNLIAPFNWLSVMFLTAGFPTILSQGTSLPLAPADFPIALSRMIWAKHVA